MCKRKFGGAGGEGEVEGRGWEGGGWASINHVCLLHGTFTMLLIKIASEQSEVIF